MAASTAPIWSASGDAERASKTLYSNSLGRSRVSPVFPKAKCVRMRISYEGHLTNRAVCNKAARAASHPHGHL
jgi:hypothetical protein